MTSSVPRRDRLEPLFAELQRTTTAGQAGDGSSVRAVLEAYTRVVRELRAVTREARGGIEHAASAIADARTFARRQRKRVRRAGRARESH